MSNQPNDQLIDRAREIAEIYTGTALEEAILFNLERNDLEIVRELVRQTENHWMSEIDAEMRQKGVKEATDVY